MLVTSRARSEEGSTIVTVLIVMLTLSVLALTLGSLVMGTTRSAVNARGSIQAKAAADAGLSAGIAEARRNSDPCGVDLIEDAAAPVYEVTSTCAANQVTFTSTGYGRDGGVNTIQAVYEYETDPGTGGDMIFYGDTTFTKEVLTYPLNTDLLSIVIPMGNFTCQAVIPANIMVSGNFNTKGGCDVQGSVIAGGVADFANGPDTVRGTLTASGTGTTRMNGQVLGNLFVGGPLNFGWTGFTYPGNVQAGGDVNLASVSISGSLTMPSGSQLQRDGWVKIPPGQVSDPPRIASIARPASVAPPAAPTFDEWFDYEFDIDDWRPYEGHHYTMLTLAKTGSGPGTCSYYNAHPATGWHQLGDITSPTVIDARECGVLTSNSGTTPSPALKANIVVLAKSFDLTGLTMKAAPGANPRVWWIVEDKNANSAPTCSGGAGNIKINGTVMDQSLTAMAYTPCVVNVAGGAAGINDEWTGSFYGGSFNYGGGLNFFGSPIALPGMTFGGGASPSDPAAGSIGNLISMRDTVPKP